MMMKMLGAGGFPLLIDTHRPADDSNPEGYFEFEPVKRLAEDVSWVGKAEGKAVKVISRLLHDLPDTFQYRVLFMRRSLDEILESQERMLKQQGRPCSSESDSERLRAAFARHLQETEALMWDTPHFDALFLGFRQVHDDPVGQSVQICEFLSDFLERSLDPDAMAEAMAAVVDRRLYRHRQ